MDIRPVDLPELRVAMIDTARRWTTSVASQAIADVPHPLSGKPLSRQADAEILEASLTAADLYFVSTPMGILAREAAKTLPSFALAPEDLPTPAGLVIFERPVDSLLHGEPAAPYLVQGFLWWVFQEAGVMVELFADRDAALAEMARLELIDKQTVEHNRHLMAPAMRMAGRSTWWPFGKDTRADETAPGVAECLGVLKAAWLLMQQPIATIHDVEADRAVRKRLRRQQREPKPVRVIELRRPAHSGPGDGSREFHHQWIVRGHWRQQWYPARQVHRPVWIAPHIKGPEGAPLIGGEKVYAWKR
ncbi:hypothetical protein ACKI1O_10880 [Streptomyces scabiei]|uniref:hypothetical protein n=2 Tax=Streptomyces scabiei TaxID=1930 RepID=UPI0038FBA3EE